MVYGVWGFPTVVRIRLSQPPAGDWLVGAWAELVKITKQANLRIIVKIFDGEEIIEE